MAARIRTIKPQMWRADGDLQSVSRDARLLFLGMISHADDDGLQIAGSAYLRSRIFPSDEDVTVDDMRRWMAELERVGCVVLYEVEGRQYAWLPTFPQHQLLRSPKPTELPHPPGFRPYALQREVLEEDLSKDESGFRARSNPEIGHPESVIPCDTSPGGTIGGTSSIPQFPTSSVDACPPATRGRKAKPSKPYDPAPDEAAIEEHRAVVGDLAPIVDRLAVQLAAQRKTGKVRPSVQLAELWLPVRSLLDEDVPRLAVREALLSASAANDGAGAPRARYIRTVAESKASALTMRAPPGAPHSNGNGSNGNGNGSSNGAGRYANPEWFDVD